MANVRVYIQPKFSGASDQSAFYDFSGHVQFDNLQWEQNDQSTASTLSASTFSILPASTTNWNAYSGATEAIRITNALADPFFHLKIYPRTEIQVRDVSTNPHTIIWGGLITRVSESRDGGALVGSLEAIDYTSLLSEAVALEYTPLGESTIKQTLTSQTYSFTPSYAERSGGHSIITVSSIAVGSPYSRDLRSGDTILVNISDDTYDGVHLVTKVLSEGSVYKIHFQQYSNVADAASSAITGTVNVNGFFTTENAPQLDSRIRILPANVYDLNTQFKWSPRSPDSARSVSFATRGGTSNTTVTITTSATHPFSKDQQITVLLTNGPTGYASLNGTYIITDTPTNNSFTYETTSAGAVTYGAATGTATGAGSPLATPIKGGDLLSNLKTAIAPGTGAAYANAGTLDGSGNLTIDLYVRPTNQVDLIANGLFESGSTTGWTPGSFLVGSGTSGPYGVGYSVYYTGSDHQDMELDSGSRIAVTAGQKYFVSWRQNSGKVNKSHLHVKFYNVSGVVVGNAHGYDICKNDVADNQWGRNYGLIVVPATAVAMTPVLHHDSFSSSYSVYYTDIQVIQITGAFGFSDKPIADNAWYNSINATGIDLRDFENPSAPEESGDVSNRLYLYAPYTQTDPLTGAKQLTSYRNTYDYVQGVWKMGGKRVETSQVANDAQTSDLALETAKGFFKQRGLPLSSFEFEHISGSLNIGDVVPFIWNDLGVAEALVVRKQTGYLIGQDLYYKVQLGGDMGFQRNTLYLVERRLKEITGDAAYFSPPPSPYPGSPTSGGIVAPAVPTATAGQKNVDLSWQYPQSMINSSAFGGFIVLRGTTIQTGNGTVSATGTGTIATITTTDAHGLVIGDEVVISGVSPAAYNGGYTVTAVPTTTSFSYANSTTAAQTTSGIVRKISEWYKASTSELPSASENPLAPETAVASYTDSNLTAGSTFAYKTAAVDVSGATPVLTGYSQVSGAVTPTDVSISFDNAYTGLGINVPKLINSVTYDNVAVTKPISSIGRSSGSFVATVTTAEAHGFTAGMPVGISNTSNDAAIKGFYKILASPATTTTTFSITTLSDTALSITGGSSNGYGDATARTNLSPNYYDDNGVARSLGDTYSLLQFPVGQIAFSQSDGKLYRNGLPEPNVTPGNGAFDGLWIRAALDAIDVSPDGTIRISADRITSGTIDAGIVNVTNLNATNLQTGKIVIDNAWGTNAGSATVLYRSKASSVATLWTSTEHGFSNADSVYVHIGDTAYDGVKTITATDVAVARQARLASTAGISLSEAHNILTGQSITTTGLSANLTGTFTVSAIAASVTHASRVGTVAAVRTSQPHAFTTSDTVTVTGVNSNFNVSNVSISGITPALAFRQQGTPVAASATSTVATLRTSNPHGFIVGDSVVVSGSGVTAWNTTQTVTSITSPISDYQRIGTAVTLRTSQYHGIQNSDSIIVSGLGSPYDGTFTVSATNGTTASLIRSQRLLTNAVIATAGPHGFRVGDSVVVSGLAAAYNGTYAVTATSVAITSKAQAATLATLTTTVPHGFINGDTVVVSGVGAPWDTTGAVISGVATTGNPTTFQYTVGTSATVTTTAATGSADNGKRFTYTLGSATTSIATTTGTGTSYGTISYTAGSGTGTVLLTAATGSPTVDNSKTFSFTATAGTVVPTSISGGTADSYQTFTYTSSSSGQIASSAITPNGSATTGKTIYFSTPSTSGTIVPASATGTVTNNRIIRYATSSGTAGLSSVVDGTVVRKTDVYAITSTNFSVDISGNIVASGASLTSATVSGQITATSGAIGGWTINSTGLSSGDVSMSSSGTYAFSAGASNEFTVTSAGALTATSASFTSASLTSASATDIVISSSTKPGILINHGATYGDIAVSTGESMSFGHWSGSNFSEDMRLDSNGNVAIYGGYLDVTGTLAISGAATFGSTGIFTSYVVASSLRPGSSAHVIDHDGTAFTFNDIIASVPGAPVSGGAGSAMFVLYSGSGNTGYYSLSRLTSSLKYKENVLDIDQSIITAAKKLRPVTFNSKNPNELGKNFLGFIAEEVHDAGLNHAVYYENDEPESLMDRPLIAALWAWVRELESRIAELEK
ncbi:hypothetical protein UFOVP1191_59 [uncultured Caudovirales phage]|uniref:Peptidase S74 domain-containing protein n=1 Tax=uncultured Caudovirales phage TaxID=2100421 RepID=A0A6J5R7Q6_9CAUD|nr:hypothetical protein UFOVP1191_59 [uncultured Caudovirales phage]